MAGIAHQLARVARIADEVVEILDPVWHGALILGFVSLLWLAVGGLWLARRRRIAARGASA